MTNTNTVEAASFVPQLRLLLSLFIFLFKTHCLLTIHYHKPCDQQKYFRIFLNIQIKARGRVCREVLLVFHRLWSLVLVENSFVAGVLYSVEVVW